jgi:hypothetical protein
MEMTPSDLIGEASRRSRKIKQEEWEPYASNKKHNRKMASMEKLQPT